MIRRGGKMSRDFCCGKLLQHFGVLSGQQLDTLSDSVQWFAAHLLHLIGNGVRLLTSVKIRLNRSPMVYI